MNRPTSPLSQHPTDPRFQGIPSDPLDKVFTTLLMERTTDGVWYDNEGTPFTDLVKEAKGVIEAHQIELVESVRTEAYTEDDAWVAVEEYKKALIKAIKGEDKDG